MTTVIVNVATSQAQFPAGTVAAGIIIAIAGFSSQTITAAPYSATFDGVPPGSYSVTSQAIDSNGNPLGALISSEAFTVAEPDVTLDVPATITVTVQ